MIAGISVIAPGFHADARESDLGGTSLLLANGIPLTQSEPLGAGYVTNSLKVTPWNGVERSEATGRHRFAIIIPRRPAGMIEPIFTAGSSSNPNSRSTARGSITTRER